MAKKIHTESPEQPPVESTDTEQFADMEQKAEDPKEAAEEPPKQTAEGNELAKGNEPAKENEPFPVGEEIRRVLALFPGYERLYIDRHGGTYAPDTPPNIRAEARLYENPYCKKNQTD